MIKQIVRIAKPIVGRLSLLATYYRCFRDINRLSAKPKNTPMGFKFVGNELMQRGQFELEETRLITQLLPHAEVVINVGANIGYYCCLALKQGKHVVAFEPINMNLQILMRNVKVNHWESQIEIFPVALSNKVGIAEIYGSGTGASLIKGWANIPDNYVSLVPCLTIEDVLGIRFEGKKCLIIIDVEGAEKLVLNGATSIISMEPKPIWMVEIAVSEHQPNGVSINPDLLSTFQIFWDSGYDAFTADRECRIVLPSEVATITTTKIDTLKTHNFLFVEAGKAAVLVSN